METKAKKEFNIKKMVLTLILMIFATTSIILAATSGVQVKIPYENEYIELRATKIIDDEIKGKQLIMELYMHDIVVCKGIDVRFKFDNTKIQTSNINTNVATTDYNEFFEFDNEFKDILGFFQPEQADNIVRAVITLDEFPEDDTDHIKNISELGYVFGTMDNLNIEKDDDGNIQNILGTGEVRIGTMSFKIDDSISSFNLEETSKYIGKDPLGENLNEYYLNENGNELFRLLEDKDLEEGVSSELPTGIWINKTGGDSPIDYASKSTFRFTDRTASKDANLTDLIISSGVIDPTDPTLSTYKTYQYTPTFSPTTLGYDLTLLENRDDLDLTITQSDANSTMKVKVPKRDQDDELVYESDGVTIDYDEVDIYNNTPLNININKLGEPDTVITIEVTAEDGKTTNEYTVTIHRPYGTIIGKIYTEPTQKTTGTNNAKIFVYDVNDTTGIIDWDAAIQTTSILGTDSVNSDLHTIVEKAMTDTNDDGTFEIMIAPGNYDILIDKPGYLDRIFVNVTVEEEQVVDLVALNSASPDSNESDLATLSDFITLFAGDCNKNGAVEILDSTLMSLNVDKVSTDSDFNENCDLNDNGTIEILDSTALTKNVDKTRKILRYSN